MHFSLYICVGILCSVLTTSVGFRLGTSKWTSSVHFTQSQSVVVRSRWFRELLREERGNTVVYSTTAPSTLPDSIGKTQLKLITFNVLAPCYKREKRIDGSSGKEEVIFESSDEQSYLKRKADIIETVLSLDADIVNLQEYWFGSKEVQKLFKEKFSAAGYHITELRRTSHWKERDDGLAVFCRSSRVTIQDYRNILFHDCGDRVAQMLLLSINAPHCNAPSQQFILVNTHLLFPHNEQSTKIRLREITKLLGFVESYKQRELCDSICGRTDVKIPVIITGDLNGDQDDSVIQYVESQNFATAKASCKKCTDSWISHKNHLNQLVMYDHVFYSNPSQQIEEKLAALPDWTNLFLNEIIQRIVKEKSNDSEGSGSSVAEIFSAFDGNKDKTVSRQEFAETLGRLGFSGEGTAAVMDAEIDSLMDIADKDGNGVIDYKEFYDLILKAVTNAEQNDFWERQRDSDKQSSWMQESYQQDVGMLRENTTTSLMVNFDHQDATRPLSMRKVYENTRPLGDLYVKDIRLYPKELMVGKWPSDYTISDHGIVEVVFEADVLPPLREDELVDLNPTAEKFTTPLSPE